MRTHEIEMIQKCPGFKQGIKNYGNRSPYPLLFLQLKQSKSAQSTVLLLGAALEFLFELNKPKSGRNDFLPESTSVY